MKAKSRYVITFNIIFTSQIFECVCGMFCCC